MYRVREIRLIWAGSKICAMVGQDLQAGVGGFGDTVTEALTDLVAAITLNPHFEVRVPQYAKQYIENGILKISCPECKHITEQAPVYKIYTYTCRGCELVSDLEPLRG